MFSIQLANQEQLMALSQIHFTNQPLSIGSVVYHDGYGRGIVAALNLHPSPHYGYNKYPYFVRFDCGHQDVFAPKELSR